jgi:hypothetical protein
MSEKVISIPVGKIKDNPLALSSNAFERVDSWIEEGVTEEGSTEKKTVLNVRIVLQEGSKVITHDKAASEINLNQDTMNFHLKEDDYLILSQDSALECHIDPRTWDGAHVQINEEDKIQKAKIFIGLPFCATYCKKGKMVSKVAPDFETALMNLAKTSGTVGKVPYTVGRKAPNHGKAPGTMGRIPKLIN